MTTLYRVFVKEPSFEDSAQPPYYTIMVKHATCGKHVANISAITEAAKSISHCDILHIAAGFSQGVVFDHDSVRDFLDLYAPDPSWLFYGSTIPTASWSGPRSSR